MSAISEIGHARYVAAQAEPGGGRPVGDALLASVVSRLRAAGCVFADDEAKLLLSTAPTAGELEDMVGRRVSGEPLEYVLGWTEFCGVRVAVDRGVFVPRRRTQLLVYLATELLGGADSTGLGAPVVVDLCCGSGAVGVALLRHRPDVQLHACDVDATAVRCARRTLEPIGGHVHRGDLFDALPRRLEGSVSIAVANAPYVPSEAVPLMPREARDHEPRTALDGGADGLDVQRRITAAAPRWLSRGGYLLVETSEQQARQTLEAFQAAGLRAHAARSDELDATAVVGERP